MKYLNKSAVVGGEKYPGFAKVIKSYKHKKRCKYVLGLNTKHCLAEYSSAIV